MSESNPDTAELERRLDKQQQELEALREAVSASGPTRRQLMQAGGALGVGALLGGGAMTAADPAAAAASTSDSDGDIGTPSQRLDAFLDGLDATSASLGSLDIGSNSALISVAATGQVTLSSGSAAVDTGLSATDATFYLALGIDDPGADAKVAGRLFWDDSADMYKVEIVEDGTSVGNPTVNYDILRVR